MSKRLLLLVLIILCAAILRLYQLSENPPGFFADEAQAGFNAYRLLQDGRDEYSKPFPLFFQAYGDYRGPVQIYATIPFVWLLGLNEYTTRFPSALFGILTIPALFLLTRELFFHRPDRNRIALFCAWLLAISPWHAHLSRSTSEGQFYVLMTVAGTAGILKTLRRQHAYRLWFTVGVICFSLIPYSYFPGRIFIPAFCTLLGILVLGAFGRTTVRLLPGIAIGLLLLLPFFRLMQTPAGWARFEAVSIFASEEKGQIASHIFHNYLSHFSVDFLFAKGDAGMPGQSITRLSVPGIGELYWFQAVLLLLGIVALLRWGKRSSFLILAFWIVLYPTGNMFTQDTSAQAMRSIIGVIPLTIISAAALMYRSAVQKTIAYGGVILVLVASIGEIGRFTSTYFIGYPLVAADYWGWQYGFRQIVEHFVREEPLYDELLVTHRFNSGDVLLKFYSVILPCGKCLVMTNPIAIDPAKRQLFALRIPDIDEAAVLYPDLRFQEQSHISLPNGQPEFFIGEFSRHDVDPPATLPETLPDTDVYTGIL